MTSYQSATEAAISPERTCYLCQKGLLRIEAPFGRKIAIVSQQDQKDDLPRKRRTRGDNFGSATSCVQLSSLWLPLPQLLIPPLVLTQWQLKRHVITFSQSTDGGKGKEWVRNLKNSG